MTRHTVLIAAGAFILTVGLVLWMLADRQSMLLSASGVLMLMIGASGAAQVPRSGDRT